MPRNMRGTLTSSNSKSVHTLIFNIILYKSCAVATPKHLGPCPPKNYVRIVAFPPILQRVSFCGVTKFLHYSTTIKLWPLIILIEGSYPSLRVSLRYWDIVETKACRRTLSQLKVSTWSSWYAGTYYGHWIVILFFRCNFLLSAHY